MSSKVRGMTEDLWRKSRDLRRLFAHLGQPTVLAQDLRFRRKCRLFGVAAVTHAWKGLTLPDVVRQAVEVAERFADGRATPGELMAARMAVYRDRSLSEFGSEGDDSLSLFRPPAVSLTDNAALASGFDAAEHAHVFVHGRGEPGGVLAYAVAAAALFRDVFGNPFRSVAFDPAWRSATAVGVARSMYEARDFAAMPVLADALEEAGCANGDVLAHCRGEGPHVRGCWVVDLILGKA